MAVSTGQLGEASFLKAIVFDVDGTLIESMAIDSKLYFSSITAVLGPVEFRTNLNDYDNVTDSGIITQLLDDNKLTLEPSTIDSIRTLFVGGLIEHIQTVGPFPAIHGATQIIERLSLSTEYCASRSRGLATILSLLLTLEMLTGIGVRARPLDGTLFLLVLILVESSPTTAFIPNSNDRLWLASRR